MAFVVPVLNSYADTDTAYITKLNNDNTNIVNAFEGVQADFTAVHNATGAAMVDDWGRRIDAADPYSGVIGAYSAVLDITGFSESTPVVRLLSSSFSGVSSALIGGKRKYFTGTKTFDLTTLSLGTGDHIVYVGLKDDGEALVTIEASTTKTSVQVPLYSIPLSVSGSTYTLSAGEIPTRVARSLLWDNTIEQLRQETTETILISYAGVTLSSLTALSDINMRFQIPYDHIFVGGSILCGKLSSTSSEFSMNIRNASSFISYLSGTLSGTGTNTAASQALTVNPLRVNVAAAADSIYEIVLSSVVSSVYSPSVTVFVKRAYNAPLD